MQRRTRRRILNTAVAIALAVTATACATTPDSRDPEERGTNQPQTMVDLIRRRAPGVNITNGSGGLVIRLRGWDSPVAGNSALVVIDGVPQERADALLDVNPEDVVRINVLKDAAASQYGLRGANGVLEIETNRGG